MRASVVQMDHPHHIWRQNVPQRFSNTAYLVLYHPRLVDSFLNRSFSLLSRSNNTSQRTYSIVYIYPASQLP